MVGVPSSKGCHTCRQRKIKCDERRPECGQCSRSTKYTCAGYYREAVFYNASTDDRPDEALTDPTPTFQRPFNRTKTRRSLLPMTSSSPRNGPSAAKRRKATRSDTQASLPPAIDDREIMKLSYFYSFLQVFLPDLGKCNVGRGQPLVSWISIVPELLQPGDLLLRTLTSLAMARLGHNNHDRNLSIQARSVRGSAVARLQMALNDKSLVCREETLAACLALTLFELLEGTRVSLAEWLAQAMRVAKLVQLRGPSLHRTAPAHQLFLGFRYTAVSIFGVLLYYSKDVSSKRKQIIASSAVRKATFLSESAWKTVPWELEPKTIDNFLLDVVVEVPGLVEEFDLIDQLYDAGQAIQRRHKLISRCWGVCSDLKAWYDSMKRQTIVSQYWPELASVDNPADDPDLGRVFPITYHFANVQAANMHLVYWAHMTTLLHTLRSTYERLGTQLGVSFTPEIFPESGARNNPCWFCNGKDTAAKLAIKQRDATRFDFDLLPRCPGLEHMWECARNIAQSMEFCMSDSMRLLGSSMVLFPLRCAINVFSHYPGRELQWARATFANISKRRGLPISTRIASVQWAGQPFEAVREEENRRCNAANSTCPLDVCLPRLDVGPETGTATLQCGIGNIIDTEFTLLRSPMLEI